MKLNILKLLSLSALVCGCSYDFPEPDPATLPSKGDADFTKTVVVGSSLTAGFMNGALYDAGQANSFPAILATQFKLVGGGDFNQPDIAATDGYYGVAAGISGVPDGTILGRLYLKGTASPKPTPKIPGQAITAYAGDKAALNNFSAYGVSIQTSLAPQLGGPATGNPYFNPYYQRFASAPGTSTLVGDAAKALGNGTFFIFWLGNDDVLGYATNGANQSDPSKPMTDVPTFTGTYNVALKNILDANANTKGLVANIPDVTSLPYFSTVAYNAVPLDQATATNLTTNLANNYNAFLAGMVTATVISQAEADKRKVTYVAGQNPILIDDETLTDLDPYMAGPYAGLKPYHIARQTTSADLVALSAGSVLGTAVPGNATAIRGVSFPLTDSYILLPSETAAIKDRIQAFNAAISAAVTANSTRVALVDVNKILGDLKASGAVGITVNGLALISTISPPYGGFSLDGIHPNARGNAYLANKFIEVINTSFKANVPQTNPNNYPANELPVP